MKNDVPTIRLVSTAETARLIERLLLKKDNGAALPEGWEILNEDQRFYALMRSAERTAFTCWHRWYATGPVIGEDHIKTALDHILPRYTPLPNLLDTIHDMDARGYTGLLQKIFTERSRILGSGLAFMKLADTETTLSEDEKLCLALYALQLRPDTKGETTPGMFLIGAFEAAEPFLTSLWRVIKAQDQPLNPHEYHTAAGRIAEWIMRSAYQWRQDSTAELLHHETSRNALHIVRDEDGRLTDVVFNPIDDAGLAALQADADMKSIFENSAKTRLHTGCPAVHAKSRDLSPNNPVRLVMDAYIRAGHNALFASQPLRAALKITL